MRKGIKGNLKIKYTVLVPKYTFIESFCTIRLFCIERSVILFKTYIYDQN